MRRAAGGGQGQLAQAQAVLVKDRQETVVDVGQIGIGRRVQPIRNGLAGGFIRGENGRQELAEGGAGAREGQGQVQEGIIGQPGQGYR